MPRKNKRKQSRGTPLSIETHKRYEPPQASQTPRARAGAASDGGDCDEDYGEDSEDEEWTSFGNSDCERYSSASENGESSGDETIKDGDGCAQFDSDKDLLWQLPHGQLPQNRCHIPDIIADLPQYKKYLLHQLGAELNAMLNKQQPKLGKKYNIKVRTCIEELSYKIDVVKRQGSSRKEFDKEVRSLRGHLLQLSTDDNTCIILHVFEGKRERKKKRKEKFTLRGTFYGESSFIKETFPLSDADSIHTFHDIGFVEPLLQKERATRKLSYEVLIPVVLDPRIVPNCLHPREVLEEDDVEDSDDEDSDVEDAANETRVHVPMNPEQFNAIRTIGVKRLVVTQGPPGTGKSTTIWNGIVHRSLNVHGFKSRCIVASVTNQAVCAVLDKFIKAGSYVALPDPLNKEQPTDTIGNGFSFTLCGNRDRLCEKMPAAFDYHLRTIAEKIVDARAEIILLKKKRDAFDAAYKSIDRLRTEYTNTEVPFHRLLSKRAYHRLVERHLLVTSGEPQYQEFANVVLRTELYANCSASTVQLDTEEVCCTSLADVHAECLMLWDSHVDTIRNKQINQVEKHILKNSDVLMCTVDTLCRKDIQEFKGDVHTLYVDEASLVPEETVPILISMHPECLVLIGDQQQLRPYSDVHFNLKSEQDKIFARSFFERCTDAGTPHTTLTKNYRNPKDQVDLLNIMTYKNVLEYAGSLDSEKTIFVEAHAFLENEKPEGISSTHNTSEVLEVSELYGKIKADVASCNKSVLIITFYKAQKQALSAQIELKAGDAIVTVDSCQGSEADIVILSCVRGNLGGSVGFTDHPNRLNVAISRAKERLYIVCNWNTFTATKKTRTGGVTHRSQRWHQLLTLCNKP